ncbi:MAG: hypothetical protein ABIP94_07020 [Planctomycetota bacterium]
MSFGTVLARELLIGAQPQQQLIAAKIGRARAYRGLGFEVVHVHIAPHLDFGHATTNGVKFACAEKAVLDVLYFHLRGRRYPFDIFTDIHFAKLDRARLDAYLARYRNPKFIRFANRVLDQR